MPGLIWVETVYKAYQQTSKIELYHIMNFVDVPSHVLLDHKA